MEGQTPFMQAVSQRAYPVAKLLLDAALKLMSRNSQSGADSSALMDMLYPSGSAPDANPLHVLCCNDTCSFTWTGNEHINQVILLPISNSHNGLHFSCVCYAGCVAVWNFVNWSLCCITDWLMLQDIFECRTCGLTGSLCCCTECAQVCHKGHDCK